MMDEGWIPLRVGGNSKGTFSIDVTLIKFLDVVDRAVTDPIKRTRKFNDNLKGLLKTVVVAVESLREVRKVKSTEMMSISTIPSWMTIEMTGAEKKWKSGRSLEGRISSIDGVHKEALEKRLVENSTRDGVM